MVKVELNTGDWRDQDVHVIVNASSWNLIPW